MYFQVAPKFPVVKRDEKRPQPATEKKDKYNIFFSYHPVVINIISPAGHLKKLPLFEVAGRFCDDGTWSDYWSEY